MFRVEAIRNHPKVGRGSCSSIDECWDDSDIIDFLDENNILTPEGAVTWALEQEGLQLQAALNARWGSDDDEQLKAWEEWNE